MPTPRVIPSCVDLHVRYTVDGQACENVHQYLYPSGVAPTPAELTSLLNEFSANVPFRAMLNNHAQLRELYARDIGAATGRAEATLTYPAGTNGLRGGDLIPSNGACNLVLRSGFTGRSRRGRKSISPFSEGDVDGNTLGNALLTLIINYVTQLLLDRVAGRFRPAVGSLKTATAYRIIAGGFLNNFVDSQKTRLLGHGR